jgi:hypothetical protein
MRKVGAALMPAIESQQGLFLVTGEAGVGKSVFTAYFASELRTAGCPIFTRGYANPAQDDLIVEFATWLQSRESISPVDCAPPILLTDTADLLPLEAMHDLAALFEAEGANRLGARVVLVARPLLLTHFDNPVLRDLKRRIRFQGRLERLQETEIPLFVHSLTPNDTGVAIANDVVAALAHHSKGLPASVKFLWTQAERMAIQEGSRIPRALHIERAARMLQPRWMTGHEVLDAPAQRVAPTYPKPFRPVRHAIRARRAHGSSFRNAAVSGAVVTILAILWAMPLHDGIGTIPPNDAPPDMQKEVAAGTTSQDAEVSPFQRRTPTDGADSAFPSPPPPSRRLPQERTQTASSGAATRSKSGPATPADTGTAGVAAEANLPGQNLLAQPAEPSAQLAEIAPLPPQLPIPQTNPPREAEPRLQLADMSPKAVSADPQCQPYVSDVDFTMRKASVRGLACRDATGAWWLVDQQTE